MIITDSNIPDKMAYAIEDRGVELHIVNLDKPKPAPVNQPFEALKKTNE